MDNGKMDPKFSALAAECRKCNATGDKIASRWVEARLKEGDETPERMERVCECGYSWYERPADAGTGPGG